MIKNNLKLILKSFEEVDIFYYLFEVKKKKVVFFV